MNKIYKGTRSILSLYTSHKREKISSSSVLHILTLGESHNMNTLNDLHIFTESRRWKMKFNISLTQNIYFLWPCKSGEQDDKAIFCQSSIEHSPCFQLEQEIFFQVSVDTVVTRDWRVFYKSITLLSHMIVCGLCKQAAYKNLSDYIHSSDNRI
jgi:hypothetical protein